jgi:hypothetical protein
MNQMFPAKGQTIRFLNGYRYNNNSLRISLFSILFVIHILALSSLLYGSDIEYGLHIKSYPVKDNEKTSLIL